MKILYIRNKRKGGYKAVRLEKGKTKNRKTWDYWSNKPFKDYVKSLIIDNKNINIVFLDRLDLCGLPAQESSNNGGGKLINCVGGLLYSPVIPVNNRKYCYRKPIFTGHMGDALRSHSTFLLNSQTWHSIERKYAVVMLLPVLILRRQH